MKIHLHLLILFGLTLSANGANEQDPEDARTVLKSVILVDVEMTNTPIKDCLDFIQVRTAEILAARGVDPNLANSLVVPPPKEFAPSLERGSVTWSSEETSAWSALVFIGRLCGFVVHERDDGKIELRAEPNPAANKAE